MDSGRLIVVSGLPGVGKSAVATRVAARLFAVHLSVDPIEEALMLSGLAPGWATGVAAYEAAGSAARLNLALGHDVVVDAVNDSEPARDTWRRAAAAASAQLHWVVLTCSDAVVHRRRLQDRDRGFTTIAEPTWAQVEQRGATLQPWADDVLCIDTHRWSTDEVAARVVASLTDPERSATSREA